MTYCLRKVRMIRLWWLVSLGVATYFCVYYVIEAYHKWERSPVIVNFATSETSISEIPFPAVTICPQHKASVKLFNFTEALLRYESPNEKNKTLETMVAYMTLLCYNTRVSSEFYNYDAFTGNIKYQKIPEFLMAVQEPIFNSVVSLYWISTDLTYTEGILSPIITSEGLCYSFNLLDRDDLFTKDVYKDYYEKASINHQPRSNWTLEKAFNKNWLGDYPLSTTMAGIYGGFYIIIETNGDDINYLCGDTIAGFKVALHHPGQLPDLNRGYFRVGLNQDVSVALTPRAIKTSVTLRDYSPKKRKCYFEKEKTLKYFKIYDQQNCMLECLTNYTFAYCGCVSFEMPRENGTKVCSLKTVHCLEKANANFYTNRNTDTLTKQIDKQDCACLPLCTSLEYLTEISQSEWDWKAVRSTFHSLNPSNKNGSENLYRSRFYVFFREMQSITLERNELYGQTDFLASCGGLLGLLTGFSLISLVEIVYYLTLRLITNLYKFGKRDWSGANELKQN